MVEELKVITMAEFDYHLMLHIKKLREGRFSQEELSKKMGLNKSFVGNVESLLQPQKYGTRHISLLAKAFGYNSIDKLLNFSTPKYDKVHITIRVTSKMNSVGLPSRGKVVEVKKVEPVE
ncbi:hypothetical protein DET49_107115 [Salegentibacter sp. 24]|uniref:helix-turn-helix domain-containing protein n=1 Tax=Salegentibacter sp. 24 TaxID=2183986 RepID=UPI00105CD51A|nr:helix-turn-helix transcriptional regulator [Salegentibacter sp. 24]TDN89199.1 hypothetical protein DET49_107115 [Salegentibacter sp. 24]